MADQKQKYQTIKVSVATHKALKQLALDKGIPVTRLVDFLLAERKKPLSDKTILNILDGAGEDLSLIGFAREIEKSHGI